MSTPAGSGYRLYRMTLVALVLFGAPVYALATTMWSAIPVHEGLQTLGFFMAVAYFFLVLIFAVDESKKKDREAQRPELPGLSPAPAFRALVSFVAHIAVFLTLGAFAAKWAVAAVLGEPWAWMLAIPVPLVMAVGALVFFGTILATIDGRDQRTAILVVLALAGCGCLFYFGADYLGMWALLAVPLAWVLVALIIDTSTKRRTRRS